MLRQISPTLHVADMRRALAFFEGSLGFRCTFKLLRAAAAGTSACYINVDDADALWAEVQKAGARVTRAIENSSYGMRDFNIADPDGNTLSFGQPIDKP